MTAGLVPSDTFSAGDRVRYRDKGRAEHAGTVTPGRPGLIQQQMDGRLLVRVVWDDDIRARWDDARHLTVQAGTR